MSKPLANRVLKRENRLLLNGDSQILIAPVNLRAGYEH